MCLLERKIPQYLTGDCWIKYVPHVYKKFQKHFENLTVHEYVVTVVPF